MKDLSIVLADWRERAATADYLHHPGEAKIIRAVCDEVAEAALEFITWLSEGDALMRSGRKKAWLRAKFREWEQAGHARRTGTKREYRMLIVPMRARLASAREAGRQAALGDRAA